MNVLRQIYYCSKNNLQITMIKEFYNLVLNQVSNGVKKLTQQSIASRII